MIEFIDYVVVDISLVDFGFKEIVIVEIEMLGFMVICEEYKEV